MNRDSMSSAFYTPVPSNKIVNRVVKPHSRASLITVNCSRKLSIDIVATYTKCCSRFRMLEAIPRRILTNPHVPVLNNGLDNKDANLICRVGDQIVPERISTVDHLAKTNGDKTNVEVYSIVDILGTGTFGEVFRCRRHQGGGEVAVKIIKNKPAYRRQSVLEIDILKTLNSNYDADSMPNIVRLLDSFDYRGHVCLVFELLEFSLFDLLAQNQYRGLPLYIVQKFTKQILNALISIKDCNVIHCDLKPENILISSGSTKFSFLSGESSVSTSISLFDWAAIASSTIRTPTISPPILSSSAAASTSSSPTKQFVLQREGIPNTQSHSDSNHISSAVKRLSLKVIDFGSACFEGKSIFKYIQSRFYRAPEVLLGYPYDGAIDMWSLGCVCCEMFLGLPLFPGVSQHNQLTRIIDMLGMPSDTMIERGRNSGKYMVAANGSYSKRSSAGDKADPKYIHSGAKYRLKTAEEYASETNTAIPVLKRYLKYNTLDDLILKYQAPSSASTGTSTASSEACMGDNDHTCAGNIDQIKRKHFLHFLKGLLALNPRDRWTAREAMAHPFITNLELSEPFAPLVDKLNKDLSFSDARKTNHIMGSKSALTPSPLKYHSPTKKTGDSNPHNATGGPGFLPTNAIQEAKVVGNTVLNAVGTISAHIAFSPLNNQCSTRQIFPSDAVFNSSPLQPPTNIMIPIPSPIYDSLPADRYYPASRPPPPSYPPPLHLASSGQQYSSSYPNHTYSCGSSSYPPLPVNYFPVSISETPQSALSYQYNNFGGYHQSQPPLPPQPVQLHRSHARTFSEGVLMPPFPDAAYTNDIGLRHSRDQVLRTSSFGIEDTSDHLMSDFGHALTRPATDQSKYFLSSRDVMTGSHIQYTNSQYPPSDMAFSPNTYSYELMVSPFPQQQQLYPLELPPLPQNPLIFRPDLSGAAHSYDSYTHGYMNTIGLQSRNSSIATHFKTHNGSDKIREHSNSNVSNHIQYDTPLHLQRDANHSSSTARPFRHGGELGRSGILRAENNSQRHYSKIKSQNIESGYSHANNYNLSRTTIENGNSYGGKQSNLGKPSLNSVASQRYATGGIGAIVEPPHDPKYEKIIYKNHKNDTHYSTETAEMRVLNLIENNQIPPNDILSNNITVAVSNNSVSALGVVPSDHQDSCVPRLSEGGSYDGATDGDEHPFFGVDDDFIVN